MERPCMSPGVTQPVRIGSNSVAYAIELRGFEEFLPVS